VRTERRLRRTVTRLGRCLDNLAAGQRQVLVLRTGYGAARPHSRRGVARRLGVGVGRVRQLERRGVRTARTLARRGACGGTSTASAGESSSGLIAPPSGPPTAGEAAAGDDSAPAASSSGGAASDQGGVRSEVEQQLPPPLEQGPGSQSAEPGGLSLAIGISLIVLALFAGFATPHLRARLRSG
jgi:hypothetical protein